MALKPEKADRSETQRRTAAQVTPNRLTREELQTMDATTAAVRLLMERALAEDERQAQGERFLGPVLDSRCGWLFDHRCGQQSRTPGIFDSWRSPQETYGSDCRNR